MYPQVGFLIPLWLLFLPHVSLMLIVNKVDDGAPRIPVIYVVTKARCVDDGKLDAELFLLEFSLDNFNLGKLVQLLVVTTAIVFGWGQLGGK